MNLDETIIKEIEQANEIEDTDEKEANYHLQIARWLKDYKRLRDQEPCRGNVYLTKEAYAELCYKAAKWNESEECGDAIDRKKAIKAVSQICSTELGRWKENPHIDAVIDALEELPTVRPSCRCQQIDKTESEE